jgi:surface polysaccharide O-acyltransferase-like enzyme
MREVPLDIIRILACIMIVAMHSPLPTGEGNGLFLSTLSYFTAPGVGLFFMISGALLLPIKTDTRFFFKHRFLKVAVPAVFWTVYIYAAIFGCGMNLFLGERYAQFLFRHRLILCFGSSIRCWAYI